MTQIASRLPARTPFTKKRKSIGDPSDWIRQSYLQSPDGPIVLEPKEPIDPPSWGRDNREWLNSLLDKHGAALLRGFNVEQVEDFHNFVLSYCPNLLQYKERSSPRHQVATDVYTSTDYPSHQSIFFHNENSYQLTWPLKIFFFCKCPAQQGGETPIADVRKVYRRLSADTIENFAQKQCMYLRNFDEALGLPWQEVFQTIDRGLVEGYCSANGIQCTWMGNNGLQTRAIRPAIATHPRTGEQVWFNHAAFFHVSTLDPAVRDGLRGAMSESDLPANTYYGDGSVIEAETVEEIRSAYRAESVSFTWQAGDILAVDNMLTAHSRNPFKGQRTILVAMAEPCSSRSLSGSS
jgi:alpha-ketoglutarate-dependent taurine dioxygenase